MKRKYLPLIIISLVLVLAIAVSLLVKGRSGKPIAMVTAPEGVLYISLEENRIHSIEGKIPVTLVVENGEIFFWQSLCPDHLCEGFGHLCKIGDMAVCMPARVSVQIVAAPNA